MVVGDVWWRWRCRWWQQPYTATRGKMGTRRASPRAGAPRLEVALISRDQAPTMAPWMNTVDRATGRRRISRDMAMIPRKSFRATRRRVPSAGVERPLSLTGHCLRLQGMVRVSPRRSRSSHTPRDIQLTARDRRSSTPHGV